MAFTINRNGEISKEEFDKLRAKFNSKTNTQAIYDSVRFILNELPLIELKRFQLLKATYDMQVKQNTLIKLINRWNIKDFLHDCEVIKTLYHYDRPEEEPPSDKDEEYLKNN